MSAQYKKAENLDAKIKKMQLPYFQWKVLFMVSEGVTVDEMSTTLEEKKTDIEAALEALSSHGLIEPVSAMPEKEVVQEEFAEPEQKQDTAEETLEEDLTTQIGELDENEVEISELEDEEETDSDSESLESLTGTEDDFISSLEEKEKPESAEIEQDVEPEEQEKSEVSEFLEGVNEMPESAEVAESGTDVTEEQIPEQPEKDEIISDVSKKTIMVIDDSIVIRKMIEIALEEEDVRIITATTGAEGMEVLDKNDPQLIILDMLLPDMNGIDLLKKIKEVKNTPVIMLSGKDSPQLVENAKEVGVDDFLPKPFRDEELVEKVKNLLS